jgi:NDP-sugar pyrophosphorylase family protein
MKLPVAILTGGLATRMRPLTETIPKALLEIGGEPFIHHQLRLLQRRGVERVVLCIGYLGEMIQAAVGGGRQFGLRAAYSSDWPELSGTGGALKKALPLLGERFMVLYGDSYLDLDYQAVAEAFLIGGAPALMTVYHNRGLYDRSNVFFESGRIVRYDKRAPDAAMEHVDYGLGCLCRSVLEGCPAEKFDLADIYSALAEQGRLAGYESSGRFYEIGSPEGLEELALHLAAGRAAAVKSNSLT